MPSADCELRLESVSMTVGAGNLFGDVSAASAGQEAFREIFSRPGLKIQRIVSHGQVSPPEFWYDQAWNEWVIVLKGSASLQFEDEPATRALGEGDYVSSPQGNATASSGRTRNGQRFGWLSISTPIQRRRADCDPAQACWRRACRERRGAS